MTNLLFSKQLLLANKYCTFTIQPTPSSATVIIDGETTNTVSVKPGTTVVYTVSASNYYTQSGSIVVDSDIVKEISLVKFPYSKNQVLLNIRSTSKTTSSITLKGKGRYKLELEAGGAAGSGWQDSNVWAGGGSGAVIVVEVMLESTSYSYSVSGKTGASGFWSCGGNGSASYFKGTNVNFTVTGGESSYGKTKNDGGTVSNFTGTVKKTILRKNGNSASGWTNVPGAENAGGASVYSVDGTAFGAGGSSTKAGNQGFLRLTFLDED